ncbi:TPA: hypothetical protein RFM73_001331 [Klebsiella pneumoniae subsp. pneumoniae]|nr:hypothetical protein [Klebsiella pneumoniae subsp. pneumoniae]
MTDITELTPEAARESGSILIIVAARMARREFFTPLHALCESGQRVVSTRALCDAVERAEEHMVSQVSKIVDGHDRLTKKLKEAESRNAELVEALESEKRICATWRKTAEANSEKLEKAQQQMTESENRVRKQNRHICELFDDNTALRQRIAGLEARTVKLPDLRQIVSGDRYVWSDGVYNYSQDVKVALAAAGIKVEAE